MQGLELDPRVAGLSRLALLSPGRPDFEPFFLDGFEVTRGEFRRFLLSQGAGAARNLGEESAQNAEVAEYPVRGITPIQAMAFARWRGMRLPTLAEWEWAVGSRGGEKGALPWGRVFDSSRLDHLKCNTAELGLGRPTAVGTFELGATRDSVGGRIYDLVGNVAEWVRLPPDHPVEGIDDRHLSGPSSVGRIPRFSWAVEAPEDEARLAFILSTMEAVHFHYQLGLLEFAGAGRLHGFPAWLGARLVPLHAEDWKEFLETRPFSGPDAIRFGFALTTAEAAFFHHQLELARLASGAFFPAEVSWLAAHLVAPVEAQHLLVTGWWWLQADALGAWWQTLDPDQRACFHLSLDLARRVFPAWFPSCLSRFAGLLVPWPGWTGLFEQRYQLDSGQALDFRFQIGIAGRALGPWVTPAVEHVAAQLVPLGLSDWEILNRPWAWAGWSHASLMEWVKQPIPDRVSQRKGYHEASSTVGFRCAASPAALLDWLSRPEGPPLTGADGEAVAAFLGRYRSWFRAALPSLPAPGADPDRWAWIQRRLS